MDSCFVPQAGSSEVGDPSIPMENNDTYLHGRVDPGNEESIHLVDAVSVKDSTRKGTKESSLLAEAGPSNIASRPNLSSGTS